jgi:hypothetical protein
VTTTVSPDGQFQTTTYPDGSVSVGPAPGSTTATTLANASALRDKALQALTTNATFLGRQSPTSAQTTAQVQALTRQVNAIIRLLVVADTSDISGT